MEGPLANFSFHPKKLTIIKMRSNENVFEEEERKEVLHLLLVG
jgi:hypothetical protein